jgi:hypothetical protein
MGAYNKQLEYLQNFREQALDDIDKYEDLNKQVESLNRGLEDLQRLRDSSVGNERLIILEKELKLTKELIQVNKGLLQQSNNDLVSA